MGLFSGVSKALFGDPTKGIDAAAAKQMGFQQKGLDYLKGLDQPLIAARNRVMPQLEGFYSGDAGVQQQFIDTAQSSPFYQQMLDMGQEGVLSDAGAMGLSRSGDTARDLNQSNQRVLQGLVGQNLAGLSQFANPSLQSANIANIYGGMGQTAGQAGMAKVQAKQDQIGQLLGLIKAGATAGAGA